MARDNDYGSIEDFWKSFSGHDAGERMWATVWCETDTQGKEYRFYVAVKDPNDEHLLIVAAAKDLYGTKEGGPCKANPSAISEIGFMYNALFCLAEKFKKKFPLANVKVGGIEYGNVNL